MVNVVIHQDKSNLLKAFCLGADRAKERIDTKLDATKVDLAQLTKELAEEWEKVAHLEKVMQDQ